MSASIECPQTRSDQFKEVLIRVSEIQAPATPFPMNLAVERDTSGSQSLFPKLKVRRRN
jgi:hypothetical protein